MSSLKVPKQAHPDRLAALGGELLKTEDLARLFATTPRTIRRWVSVGRLPGPDLRLTARTVRWRRETIEPILGIQE